ncbi:TniQ family protein [Reinekea sp. G2M2-21]|uniref:TniQ family protein n=1 Tax=Reinekea sp. G2M2-21 TaxID=2788942 RepID=UPI0018A8CF9A|nr:TniQ family protein [Reinekea sp. G2M2-21]
MLRLSHFEISAARGNNPQLFYLDERRETGCESNTSRLSRIAFKYNIPPTALYEHYFNEGRSKRSREFFNFEIASQINSCTHETIEFERKLNRMCGIEREKFYSYSYLHSVIDPKSHGLIAKHKKWCSRCYSNRRSKFGSEDESGCFDDLYWSLDHVQHCMVHGQKLSTKCPSCHRTQPYVSTSTELGYCHYCQEFLGDKYEASIDLDLLDNFKTMFTMFYVHTYDEYQLKSEQFIANMKALREAYPEATSKYIADTIGVNERTVRAWISGEKRPQIENLFAIQRALTLFGPHQLFYPTNIFMKKIILNKGLCLKFNQLSKFGVIVLKDQIKAYLQDMAAGKIEPTSREAIAEHFKIDKNYLYRHHKILCEQVSQVYNDHNLILREKLETDLSYQIERAVSDLMSKQREPSIEAIIRYFPPSLIDEINDKFTLDQMAIRIQKAVDNQSRKRKAKSKNSKYKRIGNMAFA